MTLIKKFNQWPGGLPSCIRRHETAVEDTDSATCGWRHFVREQWGQQWADGIDPDQLRRALVVQWATSSQESRDSYGIRAPDDEPPFELPDGSQNDTEPCFTGYQIHIWYDVNVCITQWTPESQARLAKCILALWDHETWKEPLGSPISLLMPLEENICDLSNDFKFRESVARPNFYDLHMAQDGTALFRDCRPKLIIDDRTLETGLALWIQFENNGVRDRAYRESMFHTGFPLELIEVYDNWDPLDQVLEQLEDLAEHDGRSPGPDGIYENEPVNMRCPIVDILFREEFYTPDPTSRIRPLRPWAEVQLENKAEFCSAIDGYAPGYREAEALGDGLAIGYELERILMDEGNPMKIIEN